MCVYKYTATWGRKTKREEATSKLKIIECTRFLYAILYWTREEVLLYQIPLWSMSKMNRRFKMTKSNNKIGSLLEINSDNSYSITNLTYITHWLNMVNGNWHSIYTNGNNVLVWYSKHQVTRYRSSV
jgi:hypothetical protein